MTARKLSVSTTPEALRKTIQIIGAAIRDGGTYVPIRQYAAELATRAGPREFAEQVGAVYDDFTKNRWRYVFDPLETELLTVTGPNIYNQILGFGVKSPGRGFGDCDDATIALGSVFQSIGFPVRIVTIAKPGARNLFDHVFAQVKVPRSNKFAGGWLTVDPVLYPNRPLGTIAPAERMAVWDVHGNLEGFQGIFPGLIKMAFTQMISSSLGGVETEGNMSMQGVSYHSPRFQDMGLEQYGFAGVDNQEPLPWTDHGIVNFGAAHNLGIINGDEIDLALEYKDDDVIGYAGSEPVVRTKMLEMCPREMAYIRRNRRPRFGAVALADDGDIYQWTEAPGMGGFFKRLVKKAKSVVKKVARGAIRRVKKVKSKISAKAKKLIKKLPGGKYLVKVYDRVKSVAMKAVKPLVKYVGKAAKKLAPIGALIPGYGPAIAAGLYQAGKIAKLADDLGIMSDDQGRPKFRSGSQAKKFQQELNKEAAREERRQRASAAREGPHIRSGRLLKAGSKAHREALRGYGLWGV